MSTTIGSARALHDIRMPLNNGHDEIPALGFARSLPIRRKQQPRPRSPWKWDSDISTPQSDIAMRKRSPKRCGRFFRRESPLGKRCLSRRNSGTRTTGRDRVFRAFEASRKRLGLDYVDLYLIHTPFAFKPGDDQDPRDASGNPIYDEGVTLRDTWTAMERLVENGSCKAIGVSDFTMERLEEVVRSARIMPAVLQVEAHPYHPQWELLDFCKQHGIVMLAFAPLGHGIKPRLLDDPVITGIARTVGQAPSQVLLAWAIQRGTAVITTRNQSPVHAGELRRRRPFPRRP